MNPAIDAPRRAQPADRRQIAWLLGAAFAADPVSRWTLGSRHAMEKAFSELGRGTHLSGGASWLVDRTGAALVQGPGDTRTLGLSSQLRILGALTQGERLLRARRSRQQAAFAARHRPRGPHFHLLALGTHPHARGSGAGAQLLAAIGSDADAAGVAVWLECTHPDNVPYYERHGYAARETGTFAPGSPPITTMERLPSPAP